MKRRHIVPWGGSIIVAFAALIAWDSRLEAGGGSGATSQRGPTLEILDLLDERKLPAGTDAQGTRWIDSGSGRLAYLLVESESMDPPIRFHYWVEDLATGTKVPGSEKVATLPLDPSNNYSLCLMADWFTPTRGHKVRVSAFDTGGSSEPRSISPIRRDTRKPDIEPAWNKTNEFQVRVTEWSAEDGGFLPFCVNVWNSANVVEGSIVYGWKDDDGNPHEGKNWPPGTKTVYIRATKKIPSAASAGIQVWALDITGLNQYVRWVNFGPVP